MLGITVPTAVRFPLSARTTFCALYILALVVNVVFGLSFGYRDSVAALDWDEREYINIATQLLNENLELSGRRTLGFPLILAAGMSITSENFIGLQAYVSIIYSLTAPLVFMLMLKLTQSMIIAAATGAAVILWPPLLYYGSSLYSESVAMPLFIAALILLPSGNKEVIRSSRNVIQCLLSGILLGIALHIRPMYLLFLPVAFFILLAEARHWRPALIRYTALIIGFLIVLLSWSFYISAKLDTPILVTANGGETLAGGLNPRLIEGNHPTWLSTANRVTLGPIPGKWLPPHETGYLSEEELQAPYAERDTILRERALTWVLNNPTDALYLQLRKLSYMWGIYPLWNGWLQTILGNAFIVPLLILTIWVLVDFRRPRLDFARLWMLPLFVSGVALISWGSWRFRLAGDIALLGLLATYLYDALLAKMAARKTLGGDAKSPAANLDVLT